MFLPSINRMTRSQALCVVLKLRGKKAGHPGPHPTGWLSKLTAALPRHLYGRPTTQATQQTPFPSWTQSRSSPVTLCPKGSLSNWPGISKLHRFIPFKSCTLLDP